MIVRRCFALVAALVAATAVTTGTANAAGEWDTSPVRAKWQALGGASFAGEKVGDEVVLDNGIRWAKFSKYDIVITWRESAGAHWTSGAISRLWLGTSPATSAATMDQVPVNRGSQAGAATAYDTGYSVYYSDAYGAHAIGGAERDKYWANGSVTGRFGWPVSGPLAVPGAEGGVEQRFSEAVSLFREPGAAQPFWISGALRDKYQALGGPAGRLNWVVADQVTTPGNGWKASVRTGSIFWSVPTGANWVAYATAAAYEQQHGGPTGPFGSPASDTKDLRYGVSTDFVNDTTIYHRYRFSTDRPFWMSGGVRETYRRYGADEGDLNWPMSDQTPAPGTDGQYVLFNSAHLQDKAILWGPRTGGHAVQKNFLAALRSGGDAAVVGLPQSDQTTVGEYESQQFENASMFEKPGRFAVIGWGFRDIWWQTGGMQSPLGMATDYYPVDVGNNVKRQNFDHGWIQCDYNVGKCSYGTS